MIMTNFLLDYDWKPSNEQMAHFTNFCDEIIDDTILANVLNPANHGKSEYTMRPHPPKVAVLRAIKMRIISEKHHDLRIERQHRDQSQDDEALEFGYEQSCNLCHTGTVFDFRFNPERRTWDLVEIGACARCSGGTAKPQAIFIEAGKLVRTPLRNMYYTIIMALFLGRFKHPYDEQSFSIILNSAINHIRAKRRETRTRRTGN